MLSQNQHHFLFNSLSAIHDLCTGNSEAQKALVAFSDYLRVNMFSHHQTKSVPFETELKHIEHYLCLEKLRYEERLQVIYDIKATDFKIPLLSVQPIVENAVSHGLFKKPGGGIIRIRTKEVNEGYIISIIDDGVGFDFEAIKESGKSFDSIEKVRNRLETMCDGTLNISSLPGAGTRVNIKIPKGEAL